MAISAPTVVRRSVFGNRRVVIADFTFSGTVAAGGESVTPASLGLSAIDTAIFNAAGNVAFAHNYDLTNSKVTVWQGTAAYTGAATHVVRATFFGN